MADFIVERPEDDVSDTPMEEREELSDPWVLFKDGSSCIDGFGAGLIITNPEGMEFTYALRFRFNATNNEAEYEALIAGLRIARKIGVQNLQANVDSKLVANQVNEVYVAKESTMIKYLEKEKKKARVIRRKAGRYEVINETLYKKSFLRPWLRCVGPLQANYVLREIHEGSYNMHSGPRSLVAKALRFGLPGEIVSDNGKQFRDNPFKDWCEKLNIRQCFASVKHPQTNGLVERANRSLGEGIKARLEAVIQVEICIPTLRTAKVDIIKNNEDLEINLDILEEKREQAAI
ncbi:reverse transcriptase domain-containing protein [Tanacetum coccineum]